MEPGKTVVIGSGIGGSGVASLLQARGRDVVLIEKNEYPGGKCSGFVRDGYLVDSGVHMFSMGPVGPHGEIDRLVGGRIQWLRRNPGSTFHVRGSFDIQYYQSQKNPGALLQFPLAAVREHAYRRRNGLVTGNASRARIRKAADELFRSGRRGGACELARTFVRLVRHGDVFVADLDELTTFEFLCGITDNELLHQNFACCSMILLVVPYTVSSAGELLWCVGNMFENAWLSVPRGGSREIPASWLSSFEKNGGELVLGDPVEKITVEDGRATGVVTSGGREYPASTVVSNAGIKQTVGLAGPDAFPAAYVDTANGLKESCSFITVKYGLSRSVVDVKAPCYFNVPDMDPVVMFDYLADGGIPDDPFLFVPVPSEWDRFAAPPGKQMVIMGVPGPAAVNDSTVEQCERILDRAEERLFELFPAMEGHISWKMRTHVRDTARITGKPTGECIGLAQSVGQTGRHKPSVSTPVEGLYLVGCDAGARGVGTEQAAASALYLAGVLEPWRL